MLYFNILTYFHLFTHYFQKQQQRYFFFKLVMDLRFTFFKQLFVTHLAQNTHTHKRIIVLLRVKEEEIFQVVVLISLSLEKKEV